MKKIKTTTALLICLLFMISESNAQIPWYLTGNAITTSAFLGTTNDTALIIKTDSQEWIRVLSGSGYGLTGFNIDTPSARVHVKEDEVGEVLFILQKEQTNKDYMRWQKTATIKGVIDSAGHIGIGISSPLDPLHILTDADGDAIHIQANTGEEDWQIGVASGNLNFEDDGIIRVTFENYGNVGIGTTSPATLLHISGTANPKIRVTDETNTVNTQLHSENSTGFVGTESNHELRIMTNNSAKITVQTDGNVGIGTVTPGAKLSVQTTGTTDILNLIETAGDTVVTVLESGNVGIGTASPTSALEVASGRIQVTGNATPSGGTGVEISHNGTDGVILSYDRSGSNYKNMRWEALQHSIQTSGSTRMTILPSGNVGIGTTSPSSKLEVNGEVEISTLPNNIDGNDVAVLWDMGNTTKLTKWVSSIKYKQNVQNLSMYKDSVLKLRPVQFQYKNSTNGKYDVGLIAEEVEQLMPNLVFYMHPRDTIGIDSAGNYITQLDTSVKEVEGVHYRKLPVYLLAIVQEQEQRLAQLDSIVSACCINQQKRMGNTGGNDKTNTGYEKKTTGDNNIHDERDKSIAVELISSDKIILYQNIPNPFGDKTTINYYLPETVQNAVMVFYDNMGRMIKEVDLTEKGNASVVVNTGKLASGIYSYSIIVDGRVVDTLRMQRVK